MIRIARHVSKDSIFRKIFDDMLEIVDNLFLERNST